MIFFGLVQWWSATAGDAPPVAEVIAVVAVAQLMPVAALGWTLCSVAGYSVGLGRLVVHRVVCDREYPLSEVDTTPQLSGGVVSLGIGGRRLRLRVSDPQQCLAALQAASSGRGA